MIKFRCSAIHSLMVEPRSKTQELSETTKTFLHQLAIELETGRRKEISTNCIKKGNEVESQGFEMFCQYFNVFLPYIEDKAKVKYQNQYITGTPDFVPLDEENFKRFGVIDLKSSWDLFTFPSMPSFDVPPAYYWQMQGYMALTGADKATLVYVLLNTPEAIGDAEVRKLSYSYPFMDLEEIEEKVKFNHTFDDLPLSRRVRTFEILKNDEDIQKIYQKIELARKYLKINYNLS